MKLSKEMHKMILDLEYLIGSECYNANAYDGWSGIQGCSYRYPVNVPDKDGRYTKIRSHINHSYLIDTEELGDKSIYLMTYKFGSNSLFVGQGILSILDYLEKRYGLDFNELEKKKTAE